MSVFVKYRWMLSLLLLLLAGAGIPFLQKAIIPNNALSVWFVEDDPDLMEYQHFHQQFGNDEIAALVIQSKEGIFSFPQLGKIRLLTSRLEKLEGVAQVYSLTNIQDLHINKGAIRYAPVIPDLIPVHKDSLQLIARKATHSPFVVNRLIDTSGTSTMLIIRMQVMDDIDAKRDAIVTSIRHTATAVLGEGQAHLGGMGVIYAGLNAITQHDFGLFIALSYLCMFCIIWLVYRRLILVLLALCTILVATTLTLSLYGALGFQVNMITMVLPTLIIILGIVDIMHIINEYQYVQGENLHDTGRAQLVTKVLQNVYKPCLYTTLTTIAGFLALTVSPMAVLREFGTFAAVGLAFALICSFVFSGLILYYLPPAPLQKVQPSWLVRWLEKQLAHVHRNPARYWLVIGMVVIVLGYGASKVVTDTYTIGYLPDNHPVVQDHQFIEQVWGDYFPLEFTVKPVAGKTIKDPQVIRAMKNFVEEASRMPEVSNGYSLHLLYDRAFPLVYGPFWENRLKSKSAIEQVTRSAMRINPELLSQWVNKDFTVGRITLVGKMLSAGNLENALFRLEKLGKIHFDGIAQIQPTGYPPLYARIVAYVMQSQKQSFLLAIGLVGICMFLLFKDFKLAFLSVVPSLFPVMLLVGVMGYFDITLDIATATVTAIVVGFSVDDTIHFMYHYQREKKQTFNLYEAQLNTVRHVGQAIVLTSLILFIGYLVLLFASVKTVFYFGLLTAIAIIGALFAQLVILPLLLKAFDKHASATPAFSKRIA